MATTYFPTGQLICLHYSVHNFSTSLVCREVTQWNLIPSFHSVFLPFTSPLPLSHSLSLSLSLYLSLPFFLSQTLFLPISMDSSFRRWDVKPFRSGGAGSSRWESSYEGAKHGAEKLLLRCAWSPDQERVACGSADRYLLL